MKLYLDQITSQGYDAVIEPYATMRIIVVNYTDSSKYFKYKVCTMQEVCGYGVLSMDFMVAENVDIAIECTSFFLLFFYYYPLLFLL